MDEQVASTAAPVARLIEEFHKLPEEEQQRLKDEMDALQEELQTVALQAPRWKREFAARLRELNEEVTGLVVEDLLDDLLAKYEGLPHVAAGEDQRIEMATVGIDIEAGPVEDQREDGHQPD